MSASDSRFVAIWASHEARARIWFRLFVLAGAGLVLSLVTTIRVWTRPREVIRIGCDGIPQVVTLDNAAYSEPNEREIRGFATEFAVFYARSDSYSVLNDLVWCANRMARSCASASSAPFAARPIPPESSRSSRSCSDGPRSTRRPSTSTSTSGPTHGR